MTEPQGVMKKVFTATANTRTGTIAVTSVGAAGAYAGPSDKSLAAILEDVFDSATNSLNVVEV